MQGGNVNPSIGTREMGRSELKYGPEQWRSGASTLLEMIFHRTAAPMIQNLLFLIHHWRNLGICKLLWEVIFIVIQMTKYLSIHSAFSKTLV